MEKPPSFLPSPERVEIRKPTDEEKFREYADELELTQEDFAKKILDVGAGSAQFAKYAKEHEISREIYSVEPRADFLHEKERAVAAKVQELPFADNSFELVVSWTAIPNMFSSVKEEKVLHRNIRESISEMLRVTKSGGEVRFGPVGKLNENFARLEEELDKVLEELKKEEGVSVDEVRHGDFIKYDKAGNIVLQTPRFLIKIKKQK